MVYFSMIVGIWIILLLRYPLTKDGRWYRQIVPAFLCNLLTFVIAKYLRVYKLVFDIEDVCCIFCGLIMIVYSVILLSQRDKEKNRTEELQEILFQEQKFDKGRLLEYLKKKIKIEIIRSDIYILQKFLDKNQELMHTEETFPKQEIKIKTSISSRTKNQETVNQFNQSEENDEMFRKSVQQLYEDGKLTVHEIAELKRFKNGLDFKGEIE